MENILVTNPNSGILLIRSRRAVDLRKELNAFLMSISDLDDILTFFVMKP